VMKVEHHRISQKPFLASVTTSRRAHHLLHLRLPAAPPGVHTPGAGAAARGGAHPAPGGGGGRGGGGGVDDQGPPGQGCVRQGLSQAGERDTMKPSVANTLKGEFNKISSTSGFS
jgi:hypothetical protein